MLESACGRYSAYGSNSEVCCQLLPQVVTAHLSLSFDGQTLLISYKGTQKVHVGLRSAPAPVHSSLSTSGISFVRALHSLPASKRRACTVSRCSVEQLTKAWAAGGQLRADGCQLTLQPDISLASLLVKLTLLGLGLAIGPQTLSSQGRDGLELASRHTGDSLQYSAADAEVSFHNAFYSSSTYSESQLRWIDIGAHEHRLAHVRRSCLRSVLHLKLAS